MCTRTERSKLAEEVKHSRRSRIFLAELKRERFGDQEGVHDVIVKHPK
jgi:hypothetical protein